MRPVVVTAILLLGVLMFMSDSAAGDLAQVCKTIYPVTPCKNKKLGEGWFQMGSNRCVKAFYNTQHLGHSDAEMTCRKFPNGHLVSIHNDAEVNQVQCAMYKATTGKAHYWIGAFLIDDGDFYKHNYRFVWTDDSSFGYTNWAGGQPDNARRREHCVEMNYWDWGLWNDANCNENKPYVCAVNV
ncbi:C-type lectin BfL-1 [Etheostoma spectabile]|uniref:C-type lectin BfL-1 n=1 Tax=Etheostoma spectabile TaxID=54343 RepID=UPI0013AFAD92|nr:C-type lectin BfL-1-like [Etheostoma spectabile]XP_032365692.1 C-type lectin BfL-1-like [Etheostoma spectabile]XP_032365693.1 C-type lectin BfL-1-like [Etheostoma spectabile]